MQHIVYCWEMGGGLGHIVALAKVVQEMQRQGNKVTCVLNDLTHASRLLAPLGIEWLATPRVRAAVRKPVPINHADALFNAGYDSVDSLYSLLSTWRTMFSLLRPDRVVCEYAPTARLAAKSLDIDTVCIDSGFSMPPLSDDVHEPLPLLRITEAYDQARLVKSEHEVLDIVNRALELLHHPTFDAFSCLFREKVWYRNWYELNHFRPHSPDRHLGQIFGDGGRVDPVWPGGAKRKLFAYLKPGHLDSLNVLQAAIDCGYSVSAYLPGFSADALKGLASTGKFVASPDPINLAKLPDDVEIGIWHSATGGVARCLETGMRMIFLPMNSEQRLACTAARTAGLPVHIHEGPGDNREMFESVRAYPRVMLGQRWTPASVSDFAHKLAFF